MGPEMKSPVTEDCPDAGVQTVVTRKGIVRDNVKTMSNKSAPSPQGQIGTDCARRESRMRDEPRNVFRSLKRPTWPEHNGPGEGGGSQV